MVASISPDPRLQFFANDGSPLVGGKLYTYAAGTTTPLATYTSSSGGTANTNPVILNSRGEASVWLGSSQYKFVLTDANNVEIWTQDNLQASANVDGSNATGTWPINISGNAATATVANSVVAGGAVNRIIAGTNITVSPGSGVGTVTVNATSSATVTSVDGAGLYGFTLPGGPITTSGTLTVTPPAPSTSGNVLTSNGTNWVSSALGFSTSTNSVGSYAFCFNASGGTYAYGDSAAGGSIYPASASGYGSSGTVLSGTWRCMGYAFSSGGTSGATLFVRIA
jgi:hypothetical protein